MPQLKLATLMAASAALLMTGCGGDSGGGDRCEQVADTLRDCDLITDGVYYCTEPGNRLDRCLFECSIGADCGELQTMFCEIRTTGALLSCTVACLDRHGFQCADGSGGIFPEWACDGESDCDDGSDEKDCPLFECADGSEIVLESFRCDGYGDCDDDSDEAGCPGLECADGSRTIPEDWRCDGAPDCPDASDEADCPDLSDGAKLICL